MSPTRLSPAPWAEAPRTAVASAPSAADPTLGGPTVGRRLTTALGPAVAVTLVLAWRASKGAAPEALAVLAAVGVVAVLVALVAPDAFRRIAHRFGHAVGHVVLVVALSVVWLLAVALPRLFGWLLRIDPFAGPPTREGSRWVDRGRRDPQPTSRWATEPALVPISRTVRRRRRLGAGALAVTAALLAAGVVVVASNTHPTSFGILSPVVDAKSLAPPFGDGTPAAYEDDPWFEQHRTDLQWMWTVATAWDPLSMLRFKDVQTQTVNIRDGVRRSWEPPADGDAEPLEVWFYGGSAAFGLGQRDEHTIASELARAAWEDGVALHVDNRGVPGWLHWQDANRFSWDVATYGPPDAVIFYDGFNEIWGEEDLEGVGDGVAPVDPYTLDYWSALVADAKAPDAPDGAKVLPTPALAPYEEGKDADLIMKRYERSRVMSRTTAEANGLEPDWFWQPSRWTRPEIEGEAEDTGFAYWSDFYGQLVDRLDPEVHDVTDALDRSRQPYYYDDVHHDEDAARIIGRALWADLRDKYTELAQQD